MDNIEILKQKALEAGFTHVGNLDADTIELRPEVRAACEKNTCLRYGTNWSCPPGCGTLEECAEKIHKFKRGVILQTTWELDTMDIDALGELSEAHGKAFKDFSKIAREMYPGCMIIGAGSCTTCKECTYPDEPCRFPDKLSYSMEGLGMIVSDVCKANDIPYYYGAGTLTYVGCALVE